MMIKHQVELVNIVSTDCQLNAVEITGSEINLVELDNRLNKEEIQATDNNTYSPKHCFEDNILTNEVISEDKVVYDPTTFIDE